MEGNRRAHKVRFFVYGTLKQGWGNHRLLVADGVNFLGEATTGKSFGFVSQGIPFVVKENVPRSHRGFIKGELYEVTNPDVQQNLDWLEGHPNFYCREETPVVIGDGGHAVSMMAWLYFHPNTFHESEFETPERECHEFKRNA